MENPQAFPSLEMMSKDKGMTLRDYFAGQAITGLMTMVNSGHAGNSKENLSGISYEIADAMLAERSNK